MSPCPYGCAARPELRRSHAALTTACDAPRPDTSYVYISVGLGFHAEMTLAEAVAFSTAREATLNAAADKLTQQAAQLKARIKLVVGAIDELMAASQPAQRR